MPTEPHAKLALQGCFLALLGNPGTALERRQGDRYPNDVGVGQEHDLERRSSHCRTEPHGLWKKSHRCQGCHASRRVKAGTKPASSQTGHLDSTGLHAMNTRRNHLSDFCFFEYGAVYYASGLWNPCSAGYLSI